MDSEELLTAYPITHVINAEAQRCRILPINCLLLSKLAAWLAQAPNSAGSIGRPRRRMAQVPLVALAPNGAGFTGCLGAEQRRFHWLAQEPNSADTIGWPRR